jgi:hypothetical protein
MSGTVSPESSLSNKEAAQGCSQQEVPENDQNCTIPTHQETTIVVVKPQEFLFSC